MSHEKGTLFYHLLPPFEQRLYDYRIYRSGRHGHFVVHLCLSAMAAS